MAVSLSQWQSNGCKHNEILWAFTHLNMDCGSILCLYTHVLPALSFYYQ